MVLALLIAAIVILLFTLFFLLRIKSITRGFERIFETLVLSTAALIIFIFSVILQVNATLFDSPILFATSVSGFIVSVMLLIALYRLNKLFLKLHRSSKSR